MSNKSSWSSWYYCTVILPDKAPAAGSLCLICSTWAIVQYIITRKIGKLKMSIAVGAWGVDYYIRVCQETDRWAGDRTTWVTHFSQVTPTFNSSTTSPKDITRARKTAQPLRTLVLEDDFVFINSTHIMLLTTASNSSTVISINVFWVLLTPGTHVRHLHTIRQ